MYKALVSLSLACFPSLTVLDNTHETTEAIKVSEAKASFVLKEFQCLKEALWFEIRGGSQQGMYAVASVITNRVKSDKFKQNSICEVVTQRKQFSYRNSLQKDQRLNIVTNNSIEKAKKEIVRNVALDVVGLLHIENNNPSVIENGNNKMLPKDVLWYTTVNTQKSWMKNMKVVTIKDGHKFMK